MFIYLFTFLASAMFFHLAKKINSKKACIFLEIIGLAILSLLAGLRDNSIGTDVNVYVASIFNYCVKGSSISTISNIFNIEIGYVAFAKLFATLGLSFKTYLFFIEFFIVFFSYYGIKKIFKENYITAFLIFLLLFYNRSLNIVRQCMAISLIIYSLPYLVDKKYLKCLICIIIAYLFHKTSVIFIFAIIFKKYFSDNKKTNIMFMLASFVFSVFILYGFDYIIKLFSSIGLISSKYIFYLSNFVNASYSVSFIDLSLVIVLIIAYICFKQTFDDKSEYSNLFFYFLCFDMLCLIVSGKYIATFRLGYYYEIPALMFFLTNIDSVFRNNKSHVLGLIIAFAFWYCMYVIGNDGNTIPYIMSSL